VIKFNLHLRGCHGSYRVVTTTFAISAFHH